MTAKTSVPPCPVDTRACPCCRCTTVRPGLSIRGEMYLVSARCTTCGSKHSMSVGRDDSATLAATMQTLFLEWTNKVTVEKRVFYAMEACLRHVVKEREDAKEFLGAKDSETFARFSRKYIAKQAIRILTSAVNQNEPEKLVVTSNLGSMGKAEVGLPPDASYYQQLLRAVGLILCEVEKLAQAGDFDEAYVNAICPRTNVACAPSTPDSRVAEACRFMRARYGLGTHDQEDTEDD